MLTSVVMVVLSANFAMSEARSVRSTSSGETFGTWHGTPVTDRRWTLGKWARCNTTCGHGIQTRQLVCEIAIRPMPRIPTSTNTPIWIKDNDMFCAGLERPLVRQRNCYFISNQCLRKKVSAGLPVWLIGPWVPCNSTCGRGYRHRPVYCYQKADGHVNDSVCLEREPKPRWLRQCNNTPCTVHWVIYPWSECSSKCGWGMKHRRVRCEPISKKGREIAQQHHSMKGCSKKEEPTRTKFCQITRCPAEQRAGEPESEERQRESMGNFLDLSSGDHQ